MAREKICGIYKITSPTGKIYIGQSVNIEDRRKHYAGLCCKQQVKLYNSIKKHGWKNHKFEIIHQCKSEELNLLEIYYVNLFQTFNSYHGLNLRDGGGSKSRLSIETRKKISLSGKGRIKSIETRKKLSEAHKGKIRTAEWCENISKGKQNISEETRKRMSDAKKNAKRKPKIYTNDEIKACSERARKWYIDNPEKAKLKAEKSIKYFKENNPNLGRKHSEETIEKMRVSRKIYYEKHAKKVVQYDLNNNILNIYNNLTEASKKSHCNKSEITNCCNKRIRIRNGRSIKSVVCGGFKWGYYGAGLPDECKKVRKINSKIENKIPNEALNEH